LGLRLEFDEVRDEDAYFASIDDDTADPEVMPLVQQLISSMSRDSSRVATACHKLRRSSILIQIPFGIPKLRDAARDFTPVIAYSCEVTPAHN
jgi:hypothetical protein